MRFSYSSEQHAIADMVRRCLESGVPVWPDSRWSSLGRITRSLALPLADLGLFGLLVPERMGGSNLRVVDGVLAVTEAGRQAAPFPIIEMILAAQAMARLAPDALDTILSGRDLATIAWTADIGFEPQDLTSDAPSKHMCLRAVPFAAEARWIVTSIKHRGRHDGLVLIDTSAQGVSVERRESLDVTCTIGDVAVVGTNAVAGVAEGWTNLCAAASVLYAADLVGSASACLDRSLRHLRDREQFGQPIGHYQALRHLAADDYVRLENSRLAVDYAAWALSVGEADALEAVNVAKGYASRACRTIAENSIQIHGGIGFTWDFPAHVSLRRILRLAGTLGTDIERFEDLAAELLDRSKRDKPAPVAAAAAARPSG